LNFCNYIIAANAIEVDGAMQHTTRSGRRNQEQSINAPSAAASGIDIGEAATTLASDAAMQPKTGSMTEVKVPTESSVANPSSKQPSPKLGTDVATKATMSDPSSKQPSPKQGTDGTIKATMFDPSSKKPSPKQGADGTTKASLKPLTKNAIIADPSSLKCPPTTGWEAILLNQMNVFKPV